MVREGDTIARLGGDEFVVVLSDLLRIEDAVRLAEKIVAGLRLPFRIEEDELFVTTSLGISVYPSDGRTGETLIKNADTAMYRAKEEGRDNYQLFTPMLNARSMNRLMLETGLRRALENGELVLHYQPILDLSTSGLVGMEALVRWRHPERGLVPPSEFISLAEETGLIVPLGAWVLRNACAQAKQWEEEGLNPPRVSVNFSTRQLQIPTLSSEVGRVLRETSLDADRLDIEITESVAMSHSEDVLTVLYALKHLGVHISMDDFGTGYSSLGMLKRLPIDTLKLDRSFLRDIETSVDDAAISRAVIVLAHGMKLKVTAEGVENPRQVAFLRRHRCDQAQGYLFSPPVPADQFRQILARGPGAASRRPAILEAEEEFGV
jgi:EAL domain-containing protein (putative c-di-GMP-specific phosphodiesterase class I)